MSTDTLFREFTNLPKGEQKVFLDNVLAYLYNLDDEDIGEIPAYVIEENRRRLAKFDAGQSKGIPYKEALSYVRSQIKAS